MHCCPSAFTTVSVSRPLIDISDTETCKEDKHEDKFLLAMSNFPVSHL